MPVIEDLVIAFIVSGKMGGILEKYKNMSEKEKQAFIREKSSEILNNTSVISDIKTNIEYYFENIEE